MSFLYFICGIIISLALIQNINILDFMYKKRQRKKDITNKSNEIPQCALPSLFSRTQCSNQYQNWQVSSKKCHYQASTGRQSVDKRSSQQQIVLINPPWIYSYSKTECLQKKIKRFLLSINFVPAFKFRNMPKALSLPFLNAKKSKTECNNETTMVTARR